MVAKHVNKKNAGKPRVLAINALLHSLLLLLKPSVMCLSIVTFNNDAKPPTKWILREFDVSWIRPRLGGLPHLETGLADQDTSLDGSPHLSRKRDQNKMRDHMDRRVTPPKRVTSPTWGPPPLCKQALSATWKNSYHLLIEFIPLASFSNWGFLGFRLFAKFQTHKRIKCSKQLKHKEDKIKNIR